MPKPGQELPPIPPEWADQVIPTTPEMERAIRDWRPVENVLGLLPRRVRMRLWRDRQIDRVACWLIDHKRVRLAELLWQATGLWRS